MTRVAATTLVVPLGVAQAASARTVTIRRPAR